jgi:hypothetical protein
MDDFGIERFARAGSVVRTSFAFAGEGRVNLYMGSGRMGCSFDAWGLMNGPPGDGMGIGNTQLMHADHWRHGPYGLDALLPVARLTWAGAPPAPPTDYRQELDIWHGVLDTRWTGDGRCVSVRAAFSPDRRDVLGMEVECSSPLPDLLLSPETDARTGHYGEHVPGQTDTLELRDNGWACRLRAGSADTIITLRILSDEQVSLASDPRGLRISLPAGRHWLLIGVAGHARRQELADTLAAVAPGRAFFSAAAAAWRRRWGSACIRVPQPWQPLAARSLFYQLATYAPEVRSPCGPCGWTNNAWPRHFPQDQSAPAALLLRMGHHDIIRPWVEFYRSRLDDMIAFTRDIWRADGAMWAWEFPIGPAADLLRDGAPNHCQYEIHNAAYPAFVAERTALHLRDAGWMRDVAWPVVRESARFYASLATRMADGAWGLHVEPSMGQDESGPPNARNYLCALTSMRFCLSAGVRMATRLGVPDDDVGRWRAMVADGVATAGLIDPATGIRGTCQLAGGEGRRHVPIGRQKHPIQLTPLTWLPMGEVDEPTRAAWRMRHELCQEAPQAYWGWSLPCMQLASARIGSPGGLLEDLAKYEPARLLDGERVQIFEGTHKHHRAFYLTSHAWFLLSLCEAMVTDWHGDVRIGQAVPPSWAQAACVNLRTADGRRWTLDRDAMYVARGTPS